MGVKVEVVRGGIYPPDRLQRLLRYLDEVKMSSMRKMIRNMPWSAPLTKQYVAYLIGKGIIGVIEAIEKYPVVDATLEAKYYYLKKYEEEVIQSLSQNSHILRLRKLEP